MLLGAFAALALVIGAVGIYGVVASATAARRRELSLRSALGARRRQLLGLAVGEGLSPVVVGVGVGLVAAAGATKLLAGLLYGVAASDPLTFGGAAALLLLVGAVAAWLPARRAAAAEPALVLRGEG